MQKKIIALAVAGLMSGAAFAQSNVTIYGVVDMYYVNGKGDVNTASGINALQSGGLSGSRLGFKGTEDLGGGLKALWVYELGTLAPDGNGANAFGTDNTRQSYLGLTGSWGTALAGRQQTLGYNFGAKYDAHGASIFSPVGQLTDNAGMTISGRDAGARQDNSFAYVSPNLSGFTLGAVYSFGTGGENVKTNAANTDPQNIWGFSVDYDMGPLSVGFTHHNINDAGGVSGTDQTENAFGVNYDFGVVKFFGSYQTSKAETAAADVANVKLWNLGVRAPIGAAGSLGFAYGQLKDSEMAGTGKAKSWGVDYQYAMSKRTTAYVGYSQVTNNNNINYGLLNIGTIAGAGDKERQFAAGLRHTF